MLLTRLPVPASAGRVDPARAAALYPAVGAGIGVFVAAVAVGGGTIWPVLVAATLAVAAELLLTGVLHLDGLADCADGLAGRDREHRLRIMKDHAIGVYAGATLVVHLLLKVAVLAALLSALTAAQLLVLLAGIHAASRGAMLPLARLLPYARSDGTGRAVVQGLGTVAVMIGLAQVMVGFIAVAWIDLAAALVLPAVMVSTTVAVGTVARRRIGGITGDVLGACAELNLVAMLLVALAVLV